jgi:hypothetical protein
MGRMRGSGIRPAIGDKRVVVSVAIQLVTLLPSYSTMADG